MEDKGASKLNCVDFYSRVNKDRRTAIFSDNRCLSQERPFTDYEELGVNKILVASPTPRPPLTSPPMRSDTR